MPQECNLNMSSYLKFIFIMFISIMFLSKCFLTPEFLSQILFYLFLEIYDTMDVFSSFGKGLEYFNFHSYGVGIFILNYIFRYSSFYYNKISWILFFMLYYIRIFTLQCILNIQNHFIVTNLSLIITGNVNMFRYPKFIFISYIFKMFLSNCFLMSDFFTTDNILFIYGIYMLLWLFFQCFENV